MAERVEDWAMLERDDKDNCLYVGFRKLKDLAGRNVFFDVKINDIIPFEKCQILVETHHEEVSTGPGESYMGDVDYAYIVTADGLEIKLTLGSIIRSISKVDELKLKRAFFEEGVDRLMAEVKEKMAQIAKLNEEIAALGE
jgi:hypothetical protein